MKNLLMMLLGVLLFAALSAKAAIIPGTYYAEIKFTRPVSATIFIKAFNKEGLNYAYGLILLQNNTGSIYRIEELADGTMVWLNLYQGKNNVLKVRNDFMPVLKGDFLQKGEKTWLQLTPTMNSQKECFPKILAEKGGKDEWADFPDSNTLYKGPGDAEGLLADDIYKGGLVFEKSSHSGNFSLGKMLPFLATVRACVVSPVTLSGWELKRDMLGLTIPIHHRGVFGSGTDQLVFMYLPAGEDICMFETSTVQSK